MGSDCLGPAHKSNGPRFDKPGPNFDGLRPDLSTF